MTRVSKAKFKADAMKLFSQIEATGEPVIITDGDLPLLEVRLVQPVTPDPLSLLRGSVLRYDQPFEPVGAHDCEEVD